MFHNFFEGKHETLAFLFVGNFFVWGASRQWEWGHIRKLILLDI